MNLEEIVVETPNKATGVQNKGLSKIELAIQNRMRARLPNKFIKEVLIPLEVKKFIVAGNSCNEEVPNDLDIYFLPDEIDFDKLEEFMEENFSDVNLYVTKNAISFTSDDTRIQCCKYSKPTLQELIKSFDFAHIQIGVLVGIDDNGVNIVDPADIIEIYYTPAWLDSRVLRKTWYTGSEYPLSSLIRAHKYAERGWLSDSNYRKTICEILNNVIHRGFHDYEDFKDQMLAIDLAELGRDSDIAWNLYRTCVAKGLVKDASSDEEEEEVK